MTIQTTTQLSKLDHRDIVLDHVIDQVLDFVATLSPSPTNTLRSVPIQDQKNTSCCVSIAVVHTLCKQWNRTDFNYFFINNYRSLLESLSDSGMSPREAYTFLYFYGCALRDTYPDDKVWINDGTVKTREIPKQVIEQSRQFCIKAFGTIHSPDVVTEVLRIGQQHPTLFGDVTITLPIFNDSPTFWRSTTPSSETARFWHDVTAVDYSEERDSYKLQNSWGPDWAEGGFTWITKDDWIDFVVQTMFSTSNQQLADVLHRSSPHASTYLTIERLVSNIENKVALGPQPNMSYIRVEGEGGSKNNVFKHPQFLVQGLVGNRLFQRLLSRGKPQSRNHAISSSSAHEARLP